MYYFSKYSEIITGIKESKVKHLCFCHHFYTNKIFHTKVYFDFQIVPPVEGKFKIRRTHARTNLDQKTTHFSKKRPQFIFQIFLFPSWHPREMNCTGPNLFGMGATNFIFKASTDFSLYIVACQAPPAIVKIGLVSARIFHFNGLLLCIRLVNALRMSCVHVTSVTHTRHA